MVNQENGFGVLCEDLLVNILCQLPKRDLLKCKCVSKAWHMIVTHVCVPRLSFEAPVSGVYFRVAQGVEVPFVTTFCPQDSKDKLHHLVAYRDSVHYVATASLKPRVVPYWYFSVDKASFPEMSLSSLLPFDHRGPDFLDCCNGLVLFVQRPKPLFFVCNPAIRQCVPVPLPPPNIHLSSLYASLAFDPSESIEYKVVISSLTNQPQCLHVFYSQTGKWKTHEMQIEPLGSSKSFKLVRYSVYLKNVLYRLSMFYKILCFDLKTMKARVLDCPSEKSPHTPEIDVEGQPPPGCIGVSNGLLSYVTEDDGNVCVWLLDKPRESCVWSLKYKICSHYLWESVRKLSLYGRLIWLRYCGFHPTSDILFMCSAYSMFMYHIGSDRFELVGILTGRTETHCGFFFPIFLYKNMFVTLKNWCNRITAKIENYEDIQDRWCYIEQ